MCVIRWKCAYSCWCCPGNIDLVTDQNGYLLIAPRCPIDCFNFGHCKGQNMLFVSTKNIKTHWIIMDTNNRGSKIKWRITFEIITASYIYFCFYLRQVLAVMGSKPIYVNPQSYIICTVGPVLISLCTCVLLRYFCNFPASAGPLGDSFFRTAVLHTCFNYSN